NTAVKVPNNPKASGPYRRVITGEKANVMAWAPAVPVATRITFRTNLLVSRRLSIDWQAFILSAYCSLLCCSTVFPDDCLLAAVHFIGLPTVIMLFSMLL